MPSISDIIYVVPKIIITTLLTFLLTAKAFAGTTPPVTTYIKTPAIPNGNNGWYVSPVQFELNATDLESGVKETYYRINGGTWQKNEFPDSLNMVTNPSFETPDPYSNSGIAYWGATTDDESVTYSHDTSVYLSGFETSSAKVETSEGLWHGVNNKDSYAVATPFGNMTASAWLKTDIATSAYYKIYVVSSDGAGGQIYTLLTQSTALTGTNDWTHLKTNFIVNDANAIGVYIDIGLEGSGTIWADAVSISDSITSATTNVTISTDNQNHVLEFYSVDSAGNIENTKNTSFKEDQTPPGGWHDSGAFRGFFGPSYYLWTYTNVLDATSGLSTFTDKYQYKTDNNPTFGRYSFLSSCSSTWKPDNWVTLISLPLHPGTKEAFLLAPKTNFCDDNWNSCKLVRFYAEDMAGNSATKEYCINGPWIKIRGEGFVRSNSTIDMLAETDGDNTDSVIEVKNTQIDFFTSTNDWKAKDTNEPTVCDYTTIWDLLKDKSEITDLSTDSGVYYFDTSTTINGAPTGYDTQTFNQVIFVNGDLTIGDDLQVSDESTALFVVNGNVNIAKNVENIGVAILSESKIYTAYDIDEGDSTETLNLRGVFSAEEFVFQRTLLGTDNNDLPSENLQFEPKYSAQLKQFFKNQNIVWENIR